MLEEFTDRFRAEHPQVGVVDRSVQEIPHLDALAVTAGRTQVADHTPELAEAFSLARVLTDEVLHSSAIVVATPMYNWGPPSALKAWLDRIVNTETFYRPTPALVGIPITFIIASGGRYTTPEMSRHDNLRPLLVECFTRMGSDPSDLVFVDCDPTGPLDRGHLDHLDEDSGWVQALAQADDAALRIRAAEPDRIAPT